MAAPKITFALIAFGPSALRPYVDYAVATLRKVGGYDGDVHVLTDHPECYDYAAENAQGKGQTNVLEIAPPETSLEQNIRNPKYKRTLFRMIKTDLLKLVPEEYEYIVFIDSDIVTTQEGCVGDFLQRNIIDTTWPEGMGIRAKWNCGLFVHLGSFILRRGYSEKLLQQWRDMFTEDDFLDRISFMKAVGERLGITQDEWNTEDADICERRAHIVGSIENSDSFLQAESLPVPDDHNGHFVSKNGAFVTPTCFTHISGARCEAYGKPYVDDVLERFVDKYEYDFCRDTTSWREYFMFKLERLGVSMEETCVHRSSRAAIIEQENQMIVKWMGLFTLVGVALIACLYWGVYKRISNAR